MCAGLRPARMASSQIADSTPSRGTGRQGRKGTARREGRMAPGTGEVWLQRALLALFVLLAVGAWWQMAGGLFLWR